MITPVLKDYLEDAGIDFQVTEHETAFTASEVAHVEDIDEWEVAKTVMMLTDQGLVMVVLPAAMKIDMDRAQTELAMPAVRLADEDDFVEAFPECEPGAEPPFGNLFDMPTFVDRTLRADRITFNAGSHTTTVTMRRSDYMDLVGADVVDLATSAR